MRRRALHRFQSFSTSAGATEAEIVPQAGRIVIGLRGVPLGVVDMREIMVSGADDGHRSSGRRDDRSTKSSWVGGGEESKEELRELWIVVPKSRFLAARSEWLKPSREYSL